MDTFRMNGIALDLNIKPNGIYFKVLFKMCVRLGLHLYLILMELKTWDKLVKVMVKKEEEKKLVYLPTERIKCLIP